MFISISMKKITWFFTFSFIVLLQKFQRTYREPHKKVGFHLKFYFGLRTKKIFLEVSDFSYTWECPFLLSSATFLRFSLFFNSPTLKVHNAATMIHNPIFVTLFIVICSFCSIKNLKGVSLLLKVRVCLFPFLWKTVLDFSPFL